MRLVTPLLFASVALALNVSAQSPTPAKPHPAAAHASTHPSAVATSTGAHACSKLPELSSKIPALPAGAPCAKPLYTMTTVPNIHVDYISPEEGPSFKETLGLDATTFSLDYIDTKVGTGELAAPHKYYSIQYTGYLVDGSKFDSSYDHPDHEPFVFGIGQHQVIPGWDTGFAGMRVGGKRRLFIPYQLAYGPSGRPPSIPAKAELIFDLEFVAQSDEKPEPKAAPVAPPATGAPKPQ
jgi:peptidylprolyl isomerase